MNKRLWIFRIRTVRYSPIFLFFALFSAGVSWGMEDASQEMQAQPGNKENLFLAMHYGEPHQHLHAEGRKSAGICPQTRTTPQAPEEDYKMKNPLKPSRQNLARGESLFNLLAEPTACKICHGARGTDSESWRKVCRRCRETSLVLKPCGKFLTGRCSGSSAMALRAWGCSPTGFLPMKRSGS